MRRSLKNHWSSQFLFKFARISQFPFSGSQMFYEHHEHQAPGGKTRWSASNMDYVDLCHVIIVTRRGHASTFNVYSRNVSPRCQSHRVYMDVNCLQTLLGFENDCLCCQFAPSPPLTLSLHPNVDWIGRVSQSSPQLFPGRMLSMRWSVDWWINKSKPLKTANASAISPPPNVQWSLKHSTSPCI